MSAAADAPGEGAGQPPLAAGEVEELVRRLSRRWSLPAPAVEWAAGHSRGEMSGDGSRLLLGTGLLADPESARFTVAHELGHLALGHVGARRRVAARILLRRLAPVAAVAALWLLLPAPALAVLPVAAFPLLAPWLRRGEEAAADAWAAAAGFPLTPGLAARYRAAEGGDPAGWSATHPSWRARCAGPRRRGPVLLLAAAACLPVAVRAAQHLLGP